MDNAKHNLKEIVKYSFKHHYKTELVITSEVLTHYYSEKEICGKKFQKFCCNNISRVHV